MRWLLLREFGHHMTYHMSMGMLLFGTLHDTHMMLQQGAWLCWFLLGEIGVTFYMPISISLLHALHYDDWGGRKSHCCAGYSWENMD